MFQDEASFGRITEPCRCWAPKGIRPIVKTHRVREYVHAYGATAPKTGECFYLVLPYANTLCMNMYLKALSERFADTMILLAQDRAVYHTTDKLEIPENIQLFYIPPATPELNPQEGLWKEIRKRGFKNKAFPTLKKVVDKLCEIINTLTPDVNKSIADRDWILFGF